MTVAVVLVVSGALVLGAAWGTYGRLPAGLEGFIVALAGGALMVSAVLELIEPSSRKVTMWAAGGMVVAGSVVFAGLDRLVKSRSSGGGAGLLAAITLDGIPENVALGVALIGTGPAGAAALSGSILLSNLPEAAGGAKEMAQGDRSKPAVMGLWVATAGLLSVAALAGHLFMAGAPAGLLALVRCFAGGAVVGSLAIEVFPQAFKEEGYLVGLAVALGLVLALYLDRLG
ncbi:MAG: hypothetical protein WB798_14170 [Nocardioidaceae bacterium]